MKKRIKGMKMGFTLIEVLIVVVMMGMLAAIAVPNFIRAKKESERRQALWKAEEQFHYSAMSTNGTEISISYKEFNGHRVSLNYYPAFKDRVVLRVRSDDSEFGGGEATLEYLKAEVTRLISATNGSPLGSSGVNFHFTGGYPIWGPHLVCTKAGVFSCLYFAEGATMSNNTITVAGQQQRDRQY